jgi:periplasmic protein TonB
MSAAASQRRGALGASLVLHGAIAMAAVLPMLDAPPSPASGPLMAVTLVFPAVLPQPAESGAEAPPHQAMGGPQEAPAAGPLAETPLPPSPPDLAQAEAVPAGPELPAITEALRRAAAPRPAPSPSASPDPVARPDPPARPVIRPLAAAAGGSGAAAPTAASAAAILPAAASAAAMAAATPPGPILVTAPRYRLPPTPPAYPPRAVEFGLTGTVLVRARVTPDGSTEETRLWRSSGHALLDAAALAAVRRWAFEPASVEGRRVEAWVEVPVHFRLN